MGKRNSPKQAVSCSGAVFHTDKGRCVGLTAWILIQVIFNSCWFSLMSMKDLTPPTHTHTWFPLNIIICQEHQMWSIVCVCVCLCACMWYFAFKPPNCNRFFSQYNFFSSFFSLTPAHPLYTLYFRSPALIGCFVVDRRYFEEIGLLDEGMEIYGGENVELGIRVSQLKDPHLMSHTAMATTRQHYTFLQYTGLIIFKISVTQCNLCPVYYRGIYCCHPSKLKYPD